MNDSWQRRIEDISYRLFKCQRDVTDRPRELYPWKKYAVNKLQYDFNARIYIYFLQNSNVSIPPTNYTRKFTTPRPPLYFPTNSGALLFRKIELRYSNKGLFLSSASTRPFEGSRRRGDDRSPRLSLPRIIYTARLLSSLLSRYFCFNSSLNESRSNAEDTAVQKRIICADDTAPAYMIDFIVRDIYMK